MSTVYGPTTVDREQNGDTTNRLSNSSLRYISSLTHVKKHQILQSLPLILAMTFLIIGLALIFVGGISLATSQTASTDPSNMILIISGLILGALSSIFFLLHLRRTNRLYCCNKKSHLNMTGHVSTNPSTDLLVSATYPPVSDVTYQQSQGDTENSQLMVQQENGSITNEDADRMVASDPRIVLRPLKSTNEDC